MDVLYKVSSLKKGSDMRDMQALIALVFCYIGHGTAHAFMMLYPTIVLGLGVAFDAPYAQLLALSTPAFIAFGAGSVPAGWLADRWSATGMLTIFFIGCGLSAIATAFAQNMWQLSLGLGMIGLFASIYHPVGIGILVANSKRLGKALGVNGMSGNLGTAIAPAMAGGLMAAFGWQAAFIVPGVVSIVIGVLFWFLVPEKTAKKPASHHKKAGEVSRRELMGVFAFLAIATIAIGVIYNALTVAMPKLFEERLLQLQADPAVIGLWISAIFTVAAVAQLLVGHVMDLWGQKRLYVMLFLIQIPTLIGAMMLDSVWLPWLSGLSMFCIIGCVLMGDALIAKYSSDRWRSTVYGIKFVLALGVSALGVPLVSIMHGKTGGFEALYYLLAGLAVLSFLLATQLPKEELQKSA